MNTRTWVSVIVVIGLTVAVVYWVSRPEPVAVKVSTVERGRVAKTVANTRAGTVKSCQRSFLAPATGGQIAFLPVKKGDRVKKGDLLLSVWNDDLKARLVLSEQEAVATQAKEEAACLRSKNAEREAKRLTQVRKKKLVSEEALDKAQTEAKALNAACRAAKSAEMVSQAQVKVSQAALEKTRLVAPFDGIVAEINGELGEFITPSPPGIPTLPAIDLVDDQCLFVTAPIDEVDAPGLKTGMPVCISIDAYSKTICNGRVQRIAPYVQDREKQARTVEVEVEFNEISDTERLLAGYSADVEIELEAVDRVLRIPTEAVLEDYHVYVLSDGVLEKRQFEPGISNWKFTEVKSGLTEGEQVVTSIAREGIEDGAYAIQE